MHDDIIPYDVSPKPKGLQGNHIFSLEQRFGNADIVEVMVILTGTSKVSVSVAVGVSRPESATLNRVGCVDLHPGGLSML